MWLLIVSIFNKFSFDVPTPWGIYFQDSATPLPKWYGKPFNLGIKLPNSGKTLELQVPSHIWKCMSGWSNYSGMVTSLKASEKNVGNRGSKSAIYYLASLFLRLRIWIGGRKLSIVVKEQRVDGSWCDKTHLRCTLMGFERDYPNKILTTQLVNKRSYSTGFDESRRNDNHNLIIDPNFLTGFVDAEGSFVLSITKSNNVKSGPLARE